MVVAGRADLTGIQTPQDTAQGLLARDSVAAQQRVIGQAEGGQLLRRGTPAPLRRAAVIESWPAAVIAQTTRASSEEIR